MSRIVGGLWLVAPRLRGCDGGEEIAWVMVRDEQVEQTG
jgi:hypothetical protein